MHVNHFSPVHITYRHFYICTYICIYIYIRSYTTCLRIDWHVNSHLVTYSYSCFYLLNLHMHAIHTHTQADRQTDRQAGRQTSKKHWESTFQHATFFGQKQHFSYTFFLPGQTSESEEICSRNFCAFEFLMTSPSKVSHAGAMSCNAIVRNTRSMRAQVRSQSKTADLTALRLCRLLFSFVAASACVFSGCLWRSESWSRSRVSELLL